MFSVLCAIPFFANVGMIIIIIIIILLLLLLLLLLLSSLSLSHVIIITIISIIFKICRSENHINILHGFVTIHQK